MNIRSIYFQICFFIGGGTCELMNLGVKNIIKEPRPYVRPFQYTDYGMPSSHSVVSWYFAVYAILFVIFR